MPTPTRATAPRRDEAHSQVLEVRQLWGDVLLDARHFRPSAGSVRVGDRMGWRWELLGVDMGFVPEPMHRVLPYLPPIWSEVRMAQQDPFAVEEDALGGETDHELFRYDGDDGWIAQPLSGDPTAVGTEPLTLALGETRFEVRVVYASRRTERLPWAVDMTMAASAGVMAGIGLCFGILVALAPPPAEISVIEEDDHGAMALLRLPPPEPEPVEPEPAPVEQAPSETVAPKDTPDTRGPRSRDRAERGGNGGLNNPDLQEARQAGIFAGGGLEAILGQDSALSAELVAATGAMFAKGEGGPGIGINGLGDRRGGLGEGGGVDGLGDVGVWGPGGPPGPGEGDFGGEKEFRGPGTTVSDPVLIGNLSRDQVDRVVKNHLAQIRYCYQRELTRSPKMVGKVSVRFTISSDGTVAGAKATTNTLGTDAVAQCVVGRFLRMQFPEPSGGGIAIVTYPFVFTPG